MIVKQLTFIHLYQLIKQFNRLALFLLILAFGWIGWRAFSDFTRELSSSPPLPQKDSSDNRGISYEAIGTGALSISSKIRRLPLPDLKREISFFGKNTRPDATIYDLLIHIGLKESRQHLKVFSGQKLYLTYVQTDRPYLEFSPKPTPLWMMPYFSESKKTFVEMGVCLFTETDEILIEEAKTFEIEDLLEKENQVEKDPFFQEAVSVLQEAKWWAPDCLFERYGGVKYFAMKDHQRLEFVSEERRDVIHVKEGDVLAWKGGRWIVSRLGKATRSLPLARLKSLSPDRLKWEIWSEDGLERTEVSHEKERGGALNFRLQETFSRIRQRTTSRVSCRIENKATILKAGDWLLHTSTGWKVLRNWREIEDVLTFQVKGELFVFNGIEKKGGKLLFSGMLFDQMRTQKQVVELSFAPKSKEKPHKKKAISTKIRWISSEKRERDQNKDKQ